MELSRQKQNTFMAPPFKSCNLIGHFHNDVSSFEIHPEFICLDANVDLIPKLAFLSATHEIVLHMYLQHNKCGEDGLFLDISASLDAKRS